MNDWPTYEPLQGSPFPDLQEVVYHCAGCGGTFRALLDPAHAALWAREGTPLCEPCVDSKLRSQKAAGPPRRRVVARIWRKAIDLASGR